MERLTERRSRRGTVTVEVALLLPLVMLLSIGLIEYGWVFLKVQQLNSAARHGARLASLPDATNSAVIAAITSEMEQSGFGGSGYSIQLSPADISGITSGQPVTVAVMVDYDQLTLTGMQMLPMPDNLHASVTMSKEGP